MTVSQGLIVASRTHHAAASRDITAQSAFELGFEKRSHRMAGAAGRGVDRQFRRSYSEWLWRGRPETQNALLGSTFPG
jgi:hypothetical protein